MMKKILSIILTVCMLLSLVALPSNVFATEGATYTPTLGSNFTFDFSSNGNTWRDYRQNHNYAVTAGEMQTDKGDTLYPLFSDGNGTYSATPTYKTITTVDGKEYEVLEISTKANTSFTPLTNGGVPFELTPGKSYTVKVKMFVPAAGKSIRSYVCLGNSSKIGASAENGANVLRSASFKHNNATVYVQYPFRGQTELSNIDGNAAVYSFASYDTNTVLGDCKCGACPGTGAHALGAKKIYNEYVDTITVPSDFFELQENGTYKKDVTGSNSKTYKINNYLTLYLGGMYTPNFATGDAYYSDTDKPATVEIPYTTYQIVSIEVEEIVPVETVHFAVGDGATTANDNTVEGTLEDGIYTVEYEQGEEKIAPTFTKDGKEVSGWYSDEDLTNKVEPANFESGKTYYPKWETPITITLYYAVDDAGNPITETVKSFAGKSLTLPTDKLSVDKTWFSNVAANPTYHIRNTYSFTADTSVYSAGYLVDTTATGVNRNQYDGDYSAKYEEGKYVIYYDSAINDDTTLTRNAFRIQKVADHTTYKIEITYKAEGGNMGFAFATANYNNIGTQTTGMHGANNASLYKINDATDGYVTATMFITTDLVGSMTETDRDDNKTVLGEYLYLTIKDRDTTGNSDIYIKDCVVTPVDEVIGTIGASKLTEEKSEEIDGEQALRYYFTYKTDDGANIYIDGEEYQVVRRGFLYRNGNFDNTDYVDASGVMKTSTGGMTVGSSMIMKDQSKSDELNSCWAYDDTNKLMTFSTYIANFNADSEKVNFDTKLMVRGYVTILVDGVEMTIYSKPVNRCVNGVDDTHDIH